MSSKHVITVAITDGAHAEEVARGAASRLGYRYINDEILDKAAEKAGVDRNTIASVEHREGLIAQIVRALGNIGSVELGDPGFVFADPTEEYRRIIQQVVLSVATEGDVVIGAHGASLTLADMPAVLRVFVTASADTRAGRIAAGRGLSAAEAQRAVEHSDRERKAYFERFFHLRTETPTQYDIVINTDVLPAEVGVDIIAAAAR